jgi:energy-coupling factor transport system ATP-binding protein
MITIRDLSYRYPASAAATGTLVLDGMGFHLDEGELALVTGPSGSGKSTLLRCLNGLVPHFTGGVISGHISVAGHNPIAEGPTVLCQYVGMVFQDPEAQFVVDRVEDEIAFALENNIQGVVMSTGEMHDRVTDVLELLRLLPLRDRSLDTLSGGERQRVAIAAALVLRPRVLVLDEPTSQLDPLAAEELLQTLVALNREHKLTIVLAEHRMERILPHATRIIHLPGPCQPIIDGSPRKALAQMDLVPPLVDLAKRLDWNPLPLTVEEARALLPPLLRTRQSDRRVRWAQGRSASCIENAERASSSTSLGQPLLQAQDVHVSYGSNKVLQGLTLQAYPGELLALMGDNGSGKTTLLRCLVGLVSPQRGRITLEGKSIHGRSTAELCQNVGYLPQNPDDLLFANTVREEIEVTLYNLGLEDHPPITPDDLLQRLGLADYADAYPRDLSVGQRQRVALGAVTVTRPRLLLLDEPTRGMDYQAKRDLVRLLRSWQDEGTAVLLVTHDVELIAEAADRVAVLAQGRIVRQGCPADVLRTETPITLGTPSVPAATELRIPQIARLFPDSNWLTVSQALAGLGITESSTHTGMSSASSSVQHENT